ncbi:hypothetical protein BpHYR1_022665 [Brachionus plicatilis]|uniref:Uncharacterized protein n=1 Tax=Brachionus plicatilis TaxID=10195 RepID=A0A3M7SJ89_BRAPC|nr:hypothetical protein BpHYR1_022665 [Brachionus plicatilis]
MNGPYQCKKFDSFGEIDFDCLQIRRIDVVYIMFKPLTGLYLDNSLNLPSVFPKSSLLFFMFTNLNGIKSNLAIFDSLIADNDEILVTYFNSIIYVKPENGSMALFNHLNHVSFSNDCKYSLHTNPELFSNSHIKFME